jgi:hypothetical protein
VLLRNEGCDKNGVPHFVDTAMAMGADLQQDGRGFAAADFDDDGDLDLVLNHNQGDTGKPDLARVRYLVNGLGQHRSWLEVRLEGRQSNRDAIGAVVRIEAAGKRQMRQVEAGSGYASEHSKRLQFGLGEATEVARLTVRWPSGVVERYEHLPVRHVVRLVEGGGMRVEAATPAPARTVGG